MPTPDEWADAEMTAEDASPKPLSRPSAEGMAALEARLVRLRQRPNTTANLHDIARTEEQLATYRRLHAGRN